MCREVQARSTRIYGNTNRPPGTDDAKTAWEEVTNNVTNIVKQVCPDIRAGRAQGPPGCASEAMIHVTVWTTSGDRCNLFLCHEQEYKIK